MTERGEKAGGIDRRLAALSDRALWLAIGAALFVLSAWPLVLVELPPFQDLPNHIASAYVLQLPPPGHDMSIDDHHDDPLRRAGEDVRRSADDQRRDDSFE